MQYANSVFAPILFLLLFACSSNQSSRDAQQNNSEEISNTLQNTNQKYMPSSNTEDGKLRDEHFRMYVSVKIKQEQLRYQLAVAPLQNGIAGNQGKKTYSDSDLEKIAINEFEFDSETYYWSKELIQKTLMNYIGSEAVSKSNNARFSNEVVIHNLSMLQKHRDELKFANSYRLKLKSSLHQLPAAKLVSKNRLIVTPEPST